MRDGAEASVTVFERAGDVDHRQHDEHERLHERYKDAQRCEQHGQADRQQEEEHTGEGVFRKDVAEQTNGQRDRSGKMAEDLDREPQRHQQDRIADELFEVMQTLRPDADEIVDQERDQPEGDRGVQI